MTPNQFEILVGLEKISTSQMKARVGWRRRISPPYDVLIFGSEAEIISHPRHWLNAPRQTRLKTLCKSGMVKDSSIEKIYTPKITAVKKDTNIMVLYLSEDEPESHLRVRRNAE